MRLLVFIGLCWGWALGAGASEDGPAGDVSPRTRPASLEWLYTADGRRTGVLLECDLTKTAANWSLLGPSPGRPVLQPLDKLLAEAGDPTAGFAVNGGFWNAELHPVGVCAGGKGIYAARTHPTGLAVVRGRGVLGPLRAEVRLESIPEDAPGTATVKAQPAAILFNPMPLPVRSPFLVDFRTYPHPVQSQIRLLATSLAATTPAPLQFNVPVRIACVSREVLEPDAVYAPGEANLVLFDPLEDGDEPTERAGAWRLEARMRCVDRNGMDLLGGKPVIFATCGGPLLIDNGVINADLGARALREERAERTAVGLNAGGDRMWIAVLMRSREVDGGVSLREVAELLRERGATDALNLDGGSSTSVWIGSVQLQLRALLPLQRPVHHILMFNRPVPFKQAE